MNENTEIIAAMAAAWGEIPTIAEDSTNPHFKSKYASLEGILRTVRPILARHGLWVSQASVPCESGASVQTRLYHGSGGSLDLGTVCVPVNKNDAQGYGSAMTYARRYGLLSALGLAAGDDDDGNLAAAAKPSAETVLTVKARITQYIRSLGFDDSDVKSIVLKAVKHTKSPNTVDGWLAVEAFLKGYDADSIMGFLNGGDSAADALNGAASKVAGGSK